MKEAEPVVYPVTFNRDGLAALEAVQDPAMSELLLKFPTVYLIRTQDEKRQLLLYVGETTDIEQRTKQHLDTDPNNRDDWAKLARRDDGRMFVIGHEHFNKSMTLDIENQLMLYLSGTKAVHALMNRRTNPQGDYYPKAEKDRIFSKIWQRLNAYDSQIFPVEKIIQNSALFKASPFHELTPAQQSARRLILDRVQNALQNDQRGQLILVEGEAGAGKTVLLSSLYYEMMSRLDRSGRAKVRTNASDRIQANLLVNHDEQLKVYTEIMYKLGVASKKGDEVTKPTHFILTHEEAGDPVDVVLIDEAHLLWTQGKQSYQGQNQLHDILARARVVIAVFDPHQVLTTTGYWTKQAYQELQNAAEQQNNLVVLKKQLRMKAGQPTLDWLNDLIFGRKVSPLPAHDAEGYEIKVFDDPAKMHAAICQQNADKAHGLSRMLATFDWPYVQGKHPDDDKTRCWEVQIGDWHLPWNLELHNDDRQQARRNKSLAWAEQPQTIDEVGSTFTIQGFDLNYAGVILGPSVTLRDGKVCSDPDKSANKKAKQRRTVGKQKIDASAELLQNEMNVLMTRGVHGLYVYACDPALRQALLAAQREV